MAANVWQIVRGPRNPLLVWAMIVLSIASIAKNIQALVVIHREQA
jgi:hypothetical protein